MAKIIITGGCGYIGSHTIIDLIERGFEPVSFDNLSRSSEQTLERIKQITGKNVYNYKVDLRDFKSTYQAFEQHSDAVGVIHFAAYKSVAESIDKSLMYYDNNINGMINILRGMQAFDIQNLIFSSSCAVYGNTPDLPVTEDTKWEQAESPYGHTKQICEQMIQSFTRSYPALKCINLRYFNPAGAHESGLLGESPTVVNTQLVPLITDTVLEKRKSITVFGDDYDTRDGSCLRDYIHIMDLAEAHSVSLERVINNKNTTPIEQYNIGSGNGVTVLEAINTFEKENKLKVNYSVGARREGDIAAIYAKTDKADKNLNWSPKKTLTEIMVSAWKWAKESHS